MNKLIIKIIKSYQKEISSKTNPHCRYRPTCSWYALEAYQKFNFFKATILTLWRIIRCNPFSKGGYDPTPNNIFDKLTEQIYKPLKRPF